MAANRLTQSGVSVLTGPQNGQPNIRITEVGVSVLFNSAPGTCGYVNVFGGAFQDPSGNSLNGGTLTVQLNVDANTCDNLQKSANVLDRVTLDANGNVPTGILNLYPNAKLSADVQGNNTIYYMKAYTAKGLLVWQKNVTVPTGSASFNLINA